MSNYETSPVTGCDEIAIKKVGPWNPYTAKAARWRQLAEHYGAPSAHDKAMADHFPLGVGFGRGRSSERRIEARVNRAGKFVCAVRQAEHYESCERAYAEGRIDSQGRSTNAASIARAEKRQTAQAKRQAKIDAAKAMMAANPLDVPGDVYATAHGYLAGPGRATVIYEHEERRKAAGKAAHGAQEAA